MNNLEKVIKGLEGVYRCVSPVNHTCGDCPYQDNHVECKRRVVSDALALLKDQEAIIERYHKADVFLAVHGWKWKVGENDNDK